MEIKSAHSKNPLAGWDISSSANAGKDEAIARAQIFVNDFSQYDESFNPPLDVWQEQLQQQGTYPGDNKVLVVITDGNNNEKRFLDSWTSN
jgi:hypothetical protein